MSSHPVALFRRPVISGVRTAALAFLLTLPMFGQMSSAQYSVRGVVRNSVTGQPIRSAFVTLHISETPPEGAPEDWQARTWAVLSGPGGEFRFVGLPPGEYYCDARSPGFARKLDTAVGLDLPQNGKSDAEVRLDLEPLG